MDTRNKTGGGLILYLKSSLKYKRMHEYEISIIETIWAEIELPNAKPFLVCSVYRPPNVQSDWIDMFEEELCIAQATGLEFILMGDFNIDLNTCTNNKFINMLQVFDLTQFVREPTRVTQTSSTLIDHVYSSHPENILTCFVSDISISDHFPVCFSRKINNRIPKIKHQKTSYCGFKHFNEVNFLRDLSQDLNMFTSDQQTINADMDRWSSIMVQHLNTHAPIKSKHVKSSRLPDWFSPDIKNMQKLRDKYKRLKQWSEYKTYRNKTRQLIRASKRKYFSESISKSKDSKHIWSHLRTLNGDSMASNKRLPEEIIINNECITQSNDIAQKLNEYFTSIADILNQNDNETPTLNTEKMTQFVNEKIPNNIFFNIPYISPEQVTYYINKLNCSKATGLDGIGPRILKLSVDAISPSIAELINKSITTGCFPSQLKQAKVLPIYKGGDKTDPSNYRPISILPTISKIFEKHVHKHLMGFLNKYKLLHESQSGFRHKHSCQTALIKLIDSWLECIDSGDMVGALFIDFRKAFDLVDHAILMKKLSIYKFSQSTLQWFNSYLSDRQQTIESDRGASDFSYVRSGVPQGSILGPTLFLFL